MNSTNPRFKRLRNQYVLIFILLIPILLISQSILSQVIEDWVAIYNGPGNYEDEATAIVIDNSGNVYVTGYSSSTNTIPSNYDYATIKYNNSGVEQWVARYNGWDSGSDIANAIAVDSSGNVYVTGESEDYAHDYATIKYNSSGVEQWVARYTGSGWNWDEANAIALDSSGNVYVTGFCYNYGTSRDYTTIKYDNAGVEQWVALYNGPIDHSNDWANAIALDSSGNIYVTGRSAVTGASFYYSDYATIKYDNSGVEQWVATYNGPGNEDDEAYAIAVDSSDNIYVTGSSYGSGTDYDYTTIKYNSSGVEQWVARYNGPENSGDGATAIVLDSSANVYVTGVSNGLGSSYDYVTIKYNNSGVEQWVATYNCPEDTSGGVNAIAIDNSGNVYINGYTNFIGGTTIKYNDSGIEQWEIKYSTIPNAMTVDGSGNVYVTGYWGSAYNHDYETIKYSQDKIRVVTPNGEDIWQTGSTHDITWLSGCYVGSSVRITLYKDNMYLTAITSDTENDDSYSWYIPTYFELGDNYKIRITSNSDNSMYDYSDNNFTIARGITVTSPNGDEIWTKGSKQTITWASAGLYSYIRITLYKSDFYQLSVNTSTSNDGLYDWIIPGSIIPGNDYKVKITSNSDSSMYDFSDNNFSIIESVTVVSPNGGENLTIGTTRDITWTSSVDLGSSLRITLYKSGVYYSTITNYTENNGSYSWTIPPNIEPGDDYKIRITSNSNNAYYDFSDNNFIIAREVTVTSPNGGENWQLGSTYNINWTSLENSGPSLRITLYKGEEYYSTITGDTPDDGSYSWIIPSIFSTGNDYKVKITSNTNSAFFDFSDNNFTIVRGITVTSPNGGENWELGTIHNINWISLGNLGPSLRITLYKGGTYYTTITGNTPDDGSYSWTIPSVFPTETDYRVRITSNSNGAYFDFSDNIFTIFIFE